MEDDFFISKDGCFAAVYDGHGGAAVSKYLRQNLHAQARGGTPKGDTHLKPSLSTLSKRIAVPFS
jgi:serine/threonine protein phosphatase PrpC